MATSRGDIILQSVQIDSPTLISYTATLIAVIGGLFIFFWSRGERPAPLLWFSLPFLMGILGAASMIHPALEPRGLGPRLGATCIILAYGFGWQMVRVFYRRPPRLWLMLLPTAFWFGVSATVLRNWDLPAVSSAMRISLIVSFSGLASYEFWRSRHTEDLPSRKILFRVFAAYCVFTLIRIPLLLILPMPLGLAPTEAWAVVAYNLASVILVLLVSVFMVTLSQERIAARHHNRSLCDGMTGAYNRLAYHQYMQVLSTEISKHRNPYALLVFDIDNFKAINDRFGHLTGDKTIVAAARVAQSTFGKRDKVFRIGGEEFVCILPDTTLQEAHDAAERLRLAFQNIAAIIDGMQLDATISIGVAATEGDIPAERLFSRADEALLNAKRSGRNCTILFNENEN